MPQVFFPLMISVDWLSLSLESAEVMSEVMDSPTFFWKQRQYGSTQYRNLYDVSYLADDGVLEPFGVFQSVPTLESWGPRMCALKIDNHLLYQGGSAMWLDYLRMFLADYELTVNNITRCDLAADFLYLRNRISGPALAKNLKTFRWWKCGSVNVSEHYMMPYTLTWSKAIDKEGIDTEIFLNNGEVAAKTQTLTFGSMSSDAQVQLYDKTDELNRTEVTIIRNGEQIRESAKEYIRDCHKLANVYSERLHTWRLEIRLRNKANFLWDEALGKERQLWLEDLDPAHIFDTYHAAADRYFRIVDASVGGTRTIDATYLKSMRGHKNRLPVIDLFPTAQMKQVFTHKRYHRPANQYHRSVINRLDQLGDRLDRIPCRYTKDSDKKAFQDLITQLDSLPDVLKADRRIIEPVKKGLQDLASYFEHRESFMSAEIKEKILNAKEVLERHYNTESPIFVRNMIATLRSVSGEMSSMLENGSKVSPHVARSAAPSDSQVLLDAAEILKGVFVNVCYDERRARDLTIYEERLEECAQYICQERSPKPRVLDYVYTCFASSKFVDTKFLDSLLLRHRDTPFGSLVHCNFMVDTWQRSFGSRQCDIEWVPPLLPIGDYREGYSPADRMASIRHDFDTNI